MQKLDLPAPSTINNQTLTKAKKVIDDLEAVGGTNIIGALETSLYLSKVAQYHSHEKKNQPIIIFLTDGDPNVGVSSTDSITTIVRERKYSAMLFILVNFCF